MAVLIDISAPLEPQLAPWPGDTPLTLETRLSLADGDTVNLATYQASLHLGTHADAPLHFAAGAASIEHVPLAAYWGPAVVIDVHRYGFEIPAEALDGVDLTSTPRVLLRTSAWTDRTEFPIDIPVISEGLADRLAAAKVRLLGLDVPSVDTLDSGDLPNHHSLHAAGIAILEGLVLDAVAPGVYELCALPLPIRGGDASPVRAVLRRA